MDEKSLQKIFYALERSPLFSEEEKIQLKVMLPDWSEDGLQAFSKTLGISLSNAFQPPARSMVPKPEISTSSVSRPAPAPPPIISTYSLDDILAKARLRTEAGLELHEEDARFIVNLIKNRRVSYE
jgi:hypothetical protein